jgi:hypothetical protein
MEVMAGEGNMLPPHALVIRGPQSQRFFDAVSCGVLGVGMYAVNELGLPHHWTIAAYGAAASVWLLLKLNGRAQDIAIGMRNKVIALKGWLDNTPR